MAKYGWTKDKGLGTNGDGRTKHITVTQKLSLTGIGGTPSGEDAIAWKQNHDFESVLKKLNVGDEGGQKSPSQDKKDLSLAKARLQGFVRAERIEGTLKPSEPAIQGDIEIVAERQENELELVEGTISTRRDKEKGSPKGAPRMAYVLCWQEFRENDHASGTEQNFEPLSKWRQCPRQLFLKY